MIKINISSDRPCEGKTTLAVEIAKFIAERTGSPVNIVSDTKEEVLVEKYHNDNSLDGIEVEIVDLNGDEKEKFQTVAVLHHLQVGKE